MTDREFLVSLQSQISAQLADPVPVPTPTPTPTPTPPAPPAGGYPGVNLWLYPGRLSTPDAGIPPETPVKGGFTVPADWTGTLEVPISGANLKVFIDHEEYVGPYTPRPGDHVISIILPAAANVPSAAGSIDVVHHP